MLPQVVIECVLSLALIAVSAAAIFSERMQPALRTDIARNTPWDAMNSRPSYWRFNHRHRPLGPEALAH